MIAWRCPTCEGHWAVMNVFTSGFSSRHEIRICENGHRWTRTQTLEKSGDLSTVKEVVLSGPEGIVGTFRSERDHRAGWAG